MRRFISTLLPLLLVAVLGSSLQAQAGWTTSRPQMTRAELNDLFSRLQTIATSRDQPADVRTQARLEADRVRIRLEQGDFRVGDELALVVEGEETLSQSFTLRPGPTLALPGVGNIDMAGVLRSEVEEFMTAQLAQYIRDPVVRVESTMRLTISGSVGQPGFYSLPPDRALTDAIMLAGGPGALAQLRGIYIERGTAQIWSGEYLQQAIADGRTLDQLSLQAGDHIVVPLQQQPFILRYLPVWSGVLSAVALVVTIATRL